MRQSHMSSKMDEVQQEGADLLKYRDLHSVEEFNFMRLLQLMGFKTHLGICR